MNIHHNTLKKAQVNGISLTEHLGRVQALWPERNIRITMDEPKEALTGILAIKTIMLEYRGLKVIQDENGTFSVMRGKQCLAEGENLQDVLSEAVDATNGDDEEEDDGSKDVDAEPDEDEGEADSEEPGEEEGGSIVKDEYRALYKTRGTPTNCDDWLARQYTKYAMSEKPAGEREITNRKTGKVRRVKVKARMSGDVAKHYAIAKTNGIDAEWPNLDNGQQCMNSRNMVRAKVVKEGVLIVPAWLTGGKQLKLKPDASWLKAMAQRRRSKATA